MQGTTPTAEEAAQQAIDAVENKERTVRFPAVQNWFTRMPPMFKYTGMGLRATPLPTKPGEALTPAQQQDLVNRQRRLYHDAALPKPIPQSEQQAILSKYCPGADLNDVFTTQLSLAVDPQILHRFVIFSTSDAIFDVCYDGTIWYKGKYPVGHVLNQYGRMFNGIPDQKLAISLGISQDALLSAGQEGINPLQYSQELARKQQQANLPKRPQTLQKLYVEDDFVKNTSLYENAINSTPLTSWWTTIKQRYPGGEALAFIAPLAMGHIALHALPVTRMLAVAQLTPEIYNRIGHATPVWWNPLRFWSKVFWSNVGRTSGATENAAAAASANGAAAQVNRLGEQYHFTVNMAKAHAVDVKHLAKSEMFHVGPSEIDFAATRGKRSQMDFFVRFDSRTKNWIVDKVQLRIAGAPHKDIEVNLPQNKFAAFGNGHVSFPSLYGENVPFTPEGAASAMLGVAGGHTARNAAGATAQRAFGMSSTPGASTAVRRGVKPAQQQSAVHLGMLAMMMAAGCGMQCNIVQNNSAQLQAASIAVAAEHADIVAWAQQQNQDY